MSMTAVQIAPVGAKTVWKLDPAHTLVEFSAKHLMISTVKGRIVGVDGIIRIDATDVANSSVEVTLDARTLDTRIEPRDQHLRSADFLDVEKFPAITFRSTSIEGDELNFKLTGDLTIRDTTRPITLEVTFEGQTKDPWGGQRAGVSPTARFDRRAHGSTWNVLLQRCGDGRRSPPETP